MGVGTDGGCVGVPGTGTAAPPSSEVSCSRSAAPVHTTHAPRVTLAVESQALLVETGNKSWIVRLLTPTDVSC